eukprot:909759-Prymnesium_polylepis.1
MSSPSGSISTPACVSSCSKLVCAADTWRPKRRCSPHKKIGRAHPRARVRGPHREPPRRPRLRDTDHVPYVASRSARVCVPCRPPPLRPPPAPRQPQQAIPHATQSARAAAERVVSRSGWRGMAPRKQGPGRMGGSGDAWSRRRSSGIQRPHHYRLRHHR